jgi:putative ABC transport system permease protein
MLGFFLLAPAFVWTVERVFGPVVAPMFGLRYALLRQQLSGGIWRAAGTAAALMVGLAVLVVMQTQGNTLLGGWRLPTRFPDVFISSPAQPLNADDVAKLGAVPGIRGDQMMPLAIASPRFGSGFGAILAMSMFPDATMFFGIDPDKAFSVYDPANPTAGKGLMELDFRDDQGNKVAPERRAQLESQARAMLKKGRHIIITEELRALKGLKVGDTFPLQTARSGEVDYTVAGIVWSPGLDVIVGMYDLDKTFEQRTASSVFGTLEDARRDFGVEAYQLFVANLEYGVERETLLQRVKDAVGKWGMLAYDIRHIKYTIENTFRQLLLLMSTVALAAMAVASLGVTNTVMASVRSRRWQFGVLRSIGVTRLQLLRLVLAEAMLLGLVGMTLGVSAGLLMSLNANGFSAGIFGYDPPLDVPWGIVGVGAATVMAIAILASLWPAVSVARAQPLSLLQAGRASA